MPLQTQDPDYTGWSGTLRYYYELGQGAVVHITATVVDDETTGHVVTFGGVDISDTLTDATLDEIARWQADKWRTLVREAAKQALLDAEPLEQGEAA